MEVPVTATQCIHPKVKKMSGNGEHNIILEMEISGKTHRYLRSILTRLE